MDQAIEIRGRFMQMACALEWHLLLMMKLCRDFRRARGYKKMTLAEKIDFNIADMQAYNMDHYLELKEHFDSLEEFKELYHHFSHDMMRVEDQVIFTCMDETPPIYNKRYDISYINDAIDRFEKIIPVFKEFGGRLYAELLESVWKKN